MKNSTNARTLAGRVEALDQRFTDLRALLLNPALMHVCAHPFFAQQIEAAIERANEEMRYLQSSEGQAAHLSEELARASADYEAAGHRVDAAWTGRDTAQERVIAANAALDMAYAELNNARDARSELATTLDALWAEDHKRANGADPLDTDDDIIPDLGEELLCHEEPAEVW